MSNFQAKPLLKYGITAAVCLVLAAVYFFSNIPLDQISDTPMVDIVLVLCDAFFVPGALTLMTGLLFWVASEGALDGVGYLGSYLVKTLIPGKRGSIERYGDYLERKRGSRKKGYGFLCIVGLAFVLIAGVLLVWFNSLYQ